MGQVDIKLHNSSTPFDPLCYEEIERVNSPTKMDTRSMKFENSSPVLDTSNIKNPQNKSLFFVVKVVIGIKVCTLRLRDDHTHAPAY